MNDVFLYVCLCTMCVTGAPGGQEATSDPLELKLHMFMNHHGGAGNRTQILGKNDK